MGEGPPNLKLPTRTSWYRRNSGCPETGNQCGGHQIKCHLPDAVLAQMEPVIKMAAE